MIKIKLKVTGERGAELEQELRKAGIELDDHADLILTESLPSHNWLIGMNDNGKEYIKTEDILYIESLGHDVIAHTRNGTYRVTERLRELEYTLSPTQFLRISNSMIIATEKVSSIKPSLFSKFTLRLEDGSEVEVTRSYYDIFKNRFGL